MANGQLDGGNGHFPYQRTEIQLPIIQVRIVMKAKPALFGSWLALLED
jgi:hypothetical protein